MNKLYLTIMMLVLSGCAAISINPKATHVQLSPNPPAKNCKFIGQLVGNQGNFFTGRWTSNENLEKGSINDLKNQAIQLKANYIQLITSRAGNTFLKETNVTNVGNAYSCPENSEIIHSAIEILR